jgi:hypothetical protein
MTLAVRKLTESTWEYQPVNSRVAWDSHNYLSLAVDDDGTIHLVGNMHSSPLIYFRSTHPFDIHSMQEIHSMTGKEEDTTTYPQFLRGAKKELLFHYRYGRSGSGYEVFNVWDSKSRTWKRLLNTPLTDGHGHMNAYMQGPMLGPDNWYHLLWVWRNTPDCATNHTLSYACSKDILHWESVRGETIRLPITISDSVLFVDTTPVNGGLINIGIKIGFDSENNAVFGYHKYDNEGNTQLFLTRFQQDRWMIKQVTQWKYRWDFHGFGTIVNELLIDPPKPSAQKGLLVFGFHHSKYGNGQVVVHEKTLEPVEIQPSVPPYPSFLDSVRSSYPGMLVNKIFDSGLPPNGTNFMLRWETLGPNRDQQRKELPPPYALLELVQY